MATEGVTKESVVVMMAAVAATLACPGKTVKSLHAQFPREGTADEPVRYEVAKHSDGRSFASMTILARQSKGVIATASVALHAHEDGRALQSVAPVREVPADSELVEIGMMPFETFLAQVTKEAEIPY